MDNNIKHTDYYIEKFLDNNIEEAIKNSLNDIESNNADYLTYFKLGLAYFFQEKTDIAINYFDKSISLNNNFIHSYYFIGYAYLRSNVNKGIENFLKALEISPNEPLILFYLGVAFEHIDIQKAIKYYTECINTNYDMVIDAYYYRAQSFYKIRKYDLAIKDFDYVININSKYDDALITRGNCYIYGDIDLEKGLIDFESIVDLSIENYVLEALHQILSFSNDFNRTLKNCNVAIEKNKTTNMEIYAFRSAMFNALKEYDKALIDVEKALAKDCNNVYYLMNKAEALVGLNEIDKAIELLLKAIKIEPEHCGVLQVLSLAYIKLNDFEKALDCMNKSLKIDNCITEHYIMRGYIKMQMGNYEDAIKDFEIVVNSEFQTYPSNQELLSAYINHSISNFELNNIDNAVNDINKSIELVYDEEFKKDLIELRDNLINKSKGIESSYKKILEKYF